MEKKLLGEMYGVKIHSPVTRSEVRQVAKNRQDFIEQKVKNENLTYQQASLDASDITEAFINSIEQEDGDKFADLYADELLAMNKNNTNIDDIKSKSEAENYHLQAQLIFNELSANLKVYGSNSALTGANPANVELALEYINRSLEIEPNNAVYLNLKGLLIWNGKGDKASALPYIKKAVELDPRNVTIQHNLKAIEDPKGCFIATAAFGTPVSVDVNELRIFRDKKLLKYRIGRNIVKKYYVISPPVADFIAEKPILKRCVRILLIPFIFIAKMVNRDVN